MLIKFFRSAPAIDLVLLSHGDLQHSGFYAYPHTHWGLRAPAYATLPVHAMARIATIEEAESIRSQEDVGALEKPVNAEENAGEALDNVVPRRKYIATLEQIRDAFDAVNTLRFSQPTHLQGEFSRFTIELQHNSNCHR